MKSLLRIAIALTAVAPLHSAEPLHEVVPGWPALPADHALGLCAGVGVDSHGRVFVFHRCGRQWSTPFPTEPIADATVSIIDGASGKLLASWGAGQFIMPHGLTVDREDNVWLTDVGLHQVFKFTYDGKLLLTLGERGRPGADPSHFNLPTDVAVLPDGSFYVSDGYKNTRVVKFAADGRYEFEWGGKGDGPGQFNLPHGIAVDARGRVYVCDRTNSRIEVFDARGEFLAQWKGPHIGRPYGVSIGPDGHIFIIDGGDPTAEPAERGKAVELDADGRVLDTFGSSGKGLGQFQMGHDIAVGPDGAVYVAESGGRRVQKFVRRPGGAALPRATPASFELAKVGNSVVPAVPAAAIPNPKRFDAAASSHAPMRPLPEPSDRPLPADAMRFIDSLKGDDAQPGSRERPWKTLAYAVRQLMPGDTLCLRAGTYYESVTVTAAGTAEKPITIRAHPGELAIVDSGIREFYESPATAWEPFPEGAPGEFRSTGTFTEGGGYGNFGDSMVPLHHYITIADLRSMNELWRSEVSDRADDPIGIYCGPGTRRDQETGRIHIRLAHTELAGLGNDAWRGETDPRKLPLVVAGHDYALQIHKARHVRIQDLVVRGAKRAAMMIEESENVELDGVTLYGGQMALRTARVNGLRVVDSALRGHAAPWHSRAHHKYRASAGYLIMADGDNFEFVRSEFTDNHDFLWLLHAETVRFHENFVDNFNDDGFEPGPKRERGQIFIFQNHISRCLNPFTAHGKSPNPVTGEAGSGVYIYRNVVDLRRGTYKAPPTKPDPSGAFLDEPTAILAHDHGSPTHPIYYVYQNTFLMSQGPWRGYYAFTWGAHLRGTTRRVFNNLFVQIDKLAELNFTAVTADDDFQSDGNLYWAVREGPGYAGEFFGKLRQSPLFVASQKKYAPGWSANDRFADPKFVSLDVDGTQSLDLRLRDDSPGIDAGVALPTELPDPLRPGGGARPDIGALPHHGTPFTVGIRGRIGANGMAFTKE